MSIRALWLLGTLVIGASSAATPRMEREAAAPRIIMFYGGPLESRIYLTDWHENLRFMAGIAESALDGVATTGDRARIGVALYWSGPRWERFAGDTAMLATLRPDDAEQRAHLLLGHAELRPLFDYRSAEGQPGLRRIGPDARAVLEAHAIPTTVSRANRSSRTDQRDHD